MTKLTARLTDAELNEIESRLGPSLKLTALVSEVREQRAESVRLDEAIELARKINAERNAMRPVVEAAVAYVENQDGSIGAVIDAVVEYRAVKP